MQFGMDVDMDVPIDSLDTGSGTVKGKRKVSAIDLTDDAGARPGKPRTLGGDRPREVVPVKEISSGGGGRLWTGEELAGGVVFPMLPVLTYLSVKVEGSDDVFEARNSESGGMFPLCSYGLQECLRFW